MSAVRVQQVPQSSRMMPVARGDLRSLVCGWSGQSSTRLQVVLDVLNLAPSPGSWWDLRPVVEVGIGGVVEAAAGDLVGGDADEQAAGAAGPGECPVYCPQPVELGG